MSCQTLRRPVASRPCPRSKHGLEVGEHNAESAWCFSSFQPFPIDKHTLIFCCWQELSMVQNA